MRRSSRLALVGSVWLLAAACVPPPPPPPFVPCPPEPATCPAPLPLSDAQRRAYLHYYSPILLKQANEIAAPGRDWIASFDFDRDGDFADNHLEWLVSLGSFVGGPSPPAWDIRPTLYSHVLEYTDCGEKTLVLLYHVYHPMQFGSIHDWERIEIRLRDVKGDPGSGEKVHYAVVTEHSWHRVADPGKHQFFDDPPNGKHLLVWQAPWDVGFVSPPTAVPQTAELQLVTDPWSRVDAALGGAGDATVRLAEKPGAAPYHYVFADRDVAAAGHVGAAPIDPADPGAQASGKAAFQTVPGAEVLRVEYELQDTADVFATHDLAAGGGGACGFLGSLFGDDCEYPCGDGRAWTCERRRVDVADPILDEAGAATELEAGLHTLPATACDVVSPSMDREGYPAKHWWWGAYLFDREGSFESEALKQGVPTGPVHGSRDQANGCTGCVGDEAFWLQHDYFLHEGKAASAGGGANEIGEWLPAGWHGPHCGGFDGRYVQLFDD